MKPFRNLSRLPLAIHLLKLYSVCRDGRDRRSEVANLAALLCPSPTSTGHRSTLRILSGIAIEFKNASGNSLTFALKLEIDGGD